MAALQTGSGSDSGATTIDDVFGYNEPTSVATDTGTEPDSQIETAEVDAGDSEGEQPEQQVADQQETLEPASQEEKTLIEKLGLDPNNPKDRKTLDFLLMQSKRINDGQDYITKLKERGPVLTEFEKQLQQGKPDLPAKQPPIERMAPGRPEATSDHTRIPIQFGDGFDHWKTNAEGIREINELYSKAHQSNEPDAIDRIERAETALMMRRFSQHVIPGLQESVKGYVQHALQEFKGRDLGPVLQERQRIEADRMDIDAHDFAISELAKDPEMKRALDELSTPGKEPVEINGRKYPAASKLQQIFAKNPQLLKMQVPHKDPQTAARLTWIERFRWAVNQAEPSTPKVQESQKQAVAQAKGQLEKDRIRQSVNAGRSTGSGRSLSASEDFLAGLSQASGGVGKSVSTLFRK